MSGGLFAKFEAGKFGRLIHDNSDIILEDFKENYANEPHKNPNFVSDKFIKFIAERGIPIKSALSG